MSGTLKVGDQLTGRWAGFVVDRISGDLVWATSDFGTFGIPAATLIREMEVTP